MENETTNALPADLAEYQASLPKCPGCGSPIDDDNPEAPFCSGSCFEDVRKRESVR